MFKSQHQIEAFEGRGGWYWRARYIGPGVMRDKIIADGSEGYSTASNARRAARRIGRVLVFAPVITVTERIPTRGR